MKKKLFRNCHWFSLAVCLSSLLFCANPIVAQNSLSEDVSVLNAKTETDRYKSVLNLSDGKYKDVYDINLKYAKEQSSIQNLGKSRKATLNAIMNSDKKKAKELKTVLDKDQYKEYSKWLKEENEKRKVEIASIDAKEKAAKAELKATKAKEKAEKAREKAEKARDKANKAVTKYRESR